MYHPRVNSLCWWTPKIRWSLVGWLSEAFTLLSLYYLMSTSPPVVPNLQEDGFISPEKKPNLRDGWSIGKTHSMFIFLGYPGIQESNCDMALRCTSNNLVDIQMRFRPSWQWITMPTTPKFPGPYGCGGQQPWWGLAVKLWAIVSIWQQISFQLAGSHISLFPLLLW